LTALPGNERQIHERIRAEPSAAAHGTRRSLSRRAPRHLTLAQRTDSRPGVRRLPPARFLILLGVLVLGAYLRWTPRAQVEDLRPWPDAIEYEESARSLAEGRGYLLWIADQGYPPRYPPGMSALIAASMPLVGNALGSGIWVVLASALAAIAGTYVLASVAAGPTAGIVAALLVATSPVHVRWSHAVMSDVPASAALVWLAVWIVSLRQRRASLLEHAALGLACGLALSIRQPLVVLGAAAGIVVAMARGGTLRERALSTSALAAGGLLGVVPQLWLNAELFGSPLRNGYGYWVAGAMFSVQSAASGPSGTPSNAWYYVSMLLAGGAPYPWPAAVLLLIGTATALWRGGTARSLALLSWLLTILFIALHVAYFARGSRLILPVVPVLAAVMALPFAPGSRGWLRAAAVALLAATLLLEAAHPEDRAPPDRVIHDTATLEKIAAVTEPDAAILARTNPFAFARVLRRDADRVWVPLRMDAHQAAIERQKLVPVRNGEVDGGWIRKPLRQPFDRAAALATVEELCRSGRPVYLSEGMRQLVPFMNQLKRVLGRRFTLTEVVKPKPYAVYRIGCGSRRGGRPPGP
jgi:4-amino-4-deoxy-L-arabinose transferase-like glycosyltransferase